MGKVPSKLWPNRRELFSCRRSLMQQVCLFVCLPVRSPCSLSAVSSHRFPELCHSPSLKRMHEHTQKRRRMSRLTAQKMGHYCLYSYSWTICPLPLAHVFLIKHKTSWKEIGYKISLAAKPVYFPAVSQLRRNMRCRKTNLFASPNCWSFGLLKGNKYLWHSICFTEDKKNILKKLAVRAEDGESPW